MPVSYIATALRDIPSDAANFSCVILCSLRNSLTLFTALPHSHIPLLYVNIIDKTTAVEK
nr:MAG TPA: hypothetical protein [Caudoviricetes sp.]